MGMVKIKGKTPKQYNRDYYEAHPELKERRRQRYLNEKQNKVTIINVDNLTIKAKNVTIINDEED